MRFSDESLFINHVDEMIRPSALQASARVRDERFPEDIETVRAYNPFENGLSGKFFLELAVGKIVPPLGPLL